MTAEIIQFPTAERKQRPKKRVEQILVTCKGVAQKKHIDLLRVAGVLTLDWKGETPWTATFDPEDESIPNIIAPIESLKRHPDTIEVACDEGVWLFAVSEEP